MSDVFEKQLSIVVYLGLVTSPVLGKIQLSVVVSVFVVVLYKFHLAVSVALVTCMYFYFKLECILK